MLLQKPIGQQTQPLGAIKLFSICSRRRTSTTAAGPASCAENTETSCPCCVCPCTALASDPLGMDGGLCGGSISCCNGPYSHWQAQWPCSKAAGKEELEREERESGPLSNPTAPWTLDGTPHQRAGGKERALDDECPPGVPLDDQWGRVEAKAPHSSSLSLHAALAEAERVRQRA
jgi:hypothetical protein